MIETVAPEFYRIGDVVEWTHGVEREIRRGTIENISPYKLRVHLPNGTETMVRKERAKIVWGTPPVR